MSSLLRLKPRCFSRSSKAWRPECLPITRRLPGMPIGFGRHDFIGLLMLEHAVLMNPGLMREGVIADDRFVDRHRNAGYLRHQTRSRIELLRCDVGIQIEIVLPAFAAPSRLLPERYCRRARRCR